MEYLERAFDDAKYGWYSKRPYLDTAIQSTVDPDMAPAGKAVMSCFVQYAPYELRESNWDAERENLGDTVQATLESFFPGFGDLVLQREVRTPLDIERTVGLSEGNIFAGEFLAPQMWFMRPAIGWANYPTPIDGYYQCGSGTHPGGCVMGAPGKLAAAKVLKDRERRARVGRGGRGARAERRGPRADARAGGAARARAAVRRRGAPAGRAGVRGGRRPAAGGARRGAAAAGDRGRPRGRRAARSRSAGRAGPCSSRCSSTSSTARSPAACGATSRAPTRCSSTRDAEQRRRYLEPSLRGERFGAYAVTEPNAGSDARTLETTAVRDGDGWVINGEKWFVTGPDNTDFMVVQAMVVEGERAAADAVLRRLRRARADG